MTRDEFNSGMEKLLPFWQKPRTEEEIASFREYMSALYEALMRMEAVLFYDVVIELRETLARGQKPMPSQFWAVYNKLTENRARAAPREYAAEDNHLFRMLEMAKAMGPEGARHVLSSPKVDRFPPEVIDILVEKANRETSVTSNTAIQQKDNTCNTDCKVE